MKKPRAIKLNVYVTAMCDDRFRVPMQKRIIPAGVFISSDGAMNAKQARKLSKWLIRAAEWADAENKE